MKSLKKLKPIITREGGKPSGAIISMKCPICTKFWAFADYERPASFEQTVRDHVQQCQVNYSPIRFRPNI